MNRLRPHVTGLALGFGLAAWGGLRGFDRPVAVALRWGAMGLGAAALATHVLQRLDESADARRRDRRVKLKLLARQLEIVQPAGSGKAPEQVPVDSWLEQALLAKTHVSEDAFEDETIDTPNAVGYPLGDVLKADEPPAPPEPENTLVSFETAMASGQWAQAMTAWQSGQASGIRLNAEPAVLDRLRAGSLEEIFRRMHSGTVRADVAELAQALAECFPESKEGRTLAQVLPVLRRSAGLCPRCARIYTGIANACHDCLRGTAEAYQIAWDEEGPGATATTGG